MELIFLKQPNSQTKPNNLEILSCWVAKKKTVYLCLQSTLCKADMTNRQLQGYVEIYLYEKGKQNKEVVIRQGHRHLVQQHKPQIGQQNKHFLLLVLS